MIKDFMILNDEVFMIEHDTSKYTLASENKSINKLIKYNERKEVIIEKNIDMTFKEDVFNHDIYGLAKDILVNSKAERIKTIKNKYRAFIEYEILEEDGSLACGGIKIDDVEVQDILKVVKITEKNELHIVKQKCFKVSSIVPVIRKKLGIMFKSPGKMLSVNIKKIEIRGDISTESDTFNQYLFNHSDGITFTPLSETPELMKDETVAMYNSCIHGCLDGENVEMIDGCIKNIIFNFNIFVDGIFEIYSVSEFIDIIRQNIIDNNTKPGPEVEPEVPDIEEIDPDNSETEDSIPETEDEVANPDVGDDGYLQEPEVIIED